MGAVCVEVYGLLFVRMVCVCVVGDDSGMCKASFAGDVPRMFSLIKNEGDRRH